MRLSISANQVTIFQNLHNAHNAINYQKVFLPHNIIFYLSQCTHWGTYPKTTKGSVRKQPTIHNATPTLINFGSICLTLILLLYKCFLGS